MSGVLFLQSDCKGTNKCAKYKKKNIIFYPCIIAALIKGLQILFISELGDEGDTLLAKNESTFEHSSKVRINN
jgi:hypothetical protein